MKPAPFEYRAARTLYDALAALGGEEDAVALSGGQSLVPLLNFRLARPALVVDLNPIPEVDYVRRAGATLRIGALARQATVERSREVAADWPLLSEAITFVGHRAIRTRGTVCGSAAHADPRAELPVALTSLGARFCLRSARGERVLEAETMFRGPFTTAIVPGELLVEIEIPAPPAGARMAFCEHARTHGDFALAGVAVVHVPRSYASIVLLGAGPGPVRAAAAEAALMDGASTDDVAEVAGESAPAGHRRALVAAVVRRAVGRVRG